MEELFEVIKNCENILYRGFSTTKSSNADWLNVSNFFSSGVSFSSFVNQHFLKQKCCGCFCQLLKHLHEIIIEAAKKDQSQSTIETIFLCIMQIVTGIKFMEQVTEIEESKEVVLTVKDPS